MVHDAASTQSTGCSGLELVETEREPPVIHRAAIATLDLERNTNESDDYDRHGRPGRTLWKLHMRPPDDDLPQYAYTVYLCPFFFPWMI